MDALLRLVETVADNRRVPKLLKPGHDDDGFLGGRRLRTATENQVLDVLVGTVPVEDDLLEIGRGRVLVPVREEMRVRGDAVAIEELKQFLAGGQSAEIHSRASGLSLRTPISAYEKAPTMRSSSSPFSNCH